MSGYPLRAPERGLAARVAAPALLPPIERLPKPLLCAILLGQWLALALRYRSLTLPSAANPNLEVGGLAGESKAAALAQIGASHARSVARWGRVAPGHCPLALRRAMALPYPVIAKPDIGWCGHGVRLVSSDAQLAAYAAAFPPGAAFLLQQRAPGPFEAGLLYHRRPGSSAGAVTAVTLREPPAVTGDGRHSLAALIAADPRLRRHDAAYPASGGHVPARGERVELTTIASVRVGGRYRDATGQMTAALSEKLDAIARSMGEFYFGRFDVRFATMAALRRGEFQIIEVNGAGAEAIQFWDPAHTLLRAFGGIFAKQKLLFETGNVMRGRGHAPVGWAALARAWLRQQRLISRYPKSN